MSSLTGRAPRDANRIPVTYGISSADGVTVVPIEVNPSTGRLLVDSTGGGGGDATASNQVSGAQKTQIVDAGGEVATVTGGKLDVNATASLAGEAIPISGATTAVGVAIVDSSGNQISSFGGGTQYADGDSALVPIGNVSMWRSSGTNTVLATADNAPMPVTDASAQITLDNIDASATAIASNTNGLATEVTLASISTAQTDKSQFTKLTDGTDTALITAAGEQNVIATAQPGVDIGDVTVNNASGAAAVNIQDGGNSITVDGTVGVSGTVTVAGNLTNNNAAPGATNVGVLPMLANASTPTLIEGNQTLLSSDLSGRVRVQGTGATGSAVPGVVAYMGVNGGGNLTGVAGSADNADAVAVSSTANRLLAVTRNTVFNGTTWDRMSGDTTGINVKAIVGALPAGTNAIGKLAANSGIDIGDVDVTSVVPGTAATNLGKAEDAAHTTGDVGVFSLGVRNDTLADVTTTSADYSQMSTDLKGRVMTAGAPRLLKGHAQTQLSNTTTETTIIAATASTFHDVYGLILANTGASTTKVSIRDDTAGTVYAIIEVPTLETRGFMLPVDSAVPQTATNKNWTAQCGTATTALEVTALYVSMV